MLAERPHGLSKVVRIRILIFCIKPIRVYRCSLRLFLSFFQTSDVCSCNHSFYYASACIRLCRSSSHFQRRTCDYVELWIVPRKSNWRCSGISGNTVCCTTVCILPVLIFRRYWKVPLFCSVGNLRFAPPKLPLNFTGVRQATSFGSACPQQAINASVIPIPGSFNFSALPFSEDCMLATYYAYYNFWLIWDQI